MAIGTLFLNVNGDLVPFDDLDGAEQAFHAALPPWEAVEFGLDLREYVGRYRSEVARADFDEARSRAGAEVGPTTR